MIILFYKKVILKDFQKYYKASLDITIQVIYNSNFNVEKYFKNTILLLLSFNIIFYLIIGDVKERCPIKKNIKANEASIIYCKRNIISIKSNINIHLNTTKKEI